jgi:hypothetical protein
MQRSEFLKLSAAAALFPAALQARQVQQTGVGNVPGDSWHFWDKKTRLTISMWELTWLSDSGKGG